MNINTKLKLIEIFCNCDDFFLQYGKEIESKLISPSVLGTHKAKLECGLVISEMMDIEIFYHLQGSKCFKYYYKYFVEEHLREYFSGLVSYNRFVQLKPRLFLYLYIFMFAYRLGDKQGLITLIRGNWLFAITFGFIRTKYLTDWQKEEKHRQAGFSDKSYI